MAAENISLMILWRANSGTKDDVRAKQLLAEVVHYDQVLAVYSGRGVSRPSVHAYDTLWMYVWPDFHQPAPVPGPVPRADIHQCASRAGDGSRAGAARQPATKDGSNGPTSVARNAGLGASVRTPSAGSGLIIRI